MAILDRHFADLTMLVAFLAATSIRFLPEEITAPEFVPFCSLIGGVSGAYWGALMNRQGGLPKQESFQGVILGTLFGFLFIAFGASNA